MADCVVYYYKRQKDDCGFRRKTQLKKRRQYIEAKRTSMDDGLRGPYANFPSASTSVSGLYGLGTQTRSGTVP